jgi:uncharacterized membrane protein YGL010W
MKLPLPQRSLRDYMAQYAKEHTHLGTKLTHMVGIPMILASFPTALVNPPAAGGLFVGGWALQIVGHSFFEKNKPAFISDPYYLAVGAVWATVEWMHLLRIPVPEALTPTPDAPEAPVADATAAPATNGHAAAAAS